MPSLRQRARTVLAADETIDQANALLERLDGTLDQFDATLAEFNATLSRFTDALEEFLPVVKRVDALGSELERTTARVDELASGIGGVATPALRVPDQVRKFAGRAFGQNEDDPPAADPPPDPPDVPNTVK